MCLRATMQPASFNTKPLSCIMQIIEGVWQRDQMAAAIGNDAVVRLTFRSSW